MDYIKLINAVAGATTTSAHLAMILDTIDCYTSGGSRLTTSPGAVQPNTGRAMTSIARIDSWEIEMAWWEAQDRG